MASSIVQFPVICLLLTSFFLSACCYSELAIKECEYLQQGHNNTGRVAVTGMLKTRLLLISSDLFVFELPPRRLVSGLVLNGSTPTELQQRWPALRTAFNRSVTIQSDENNELLLLDGELRENGLNCTLFSITTGHVESRLFEYDNISSLELAGHWLSSPEEHRFYVIDANEETLTKYAIDVKKNTLRPDGVPLRMCKQSDTFGGSEQLILRLNDECNYRLNWTFSSGGFTDGKWFVMLGDELVHIFDAVAVAKPGTTVQVTTMNFSEFIICPQRDLEGLRKMHKAIALVIVLLLFVLIIFMVMVHVYLLQRGAFQKTPSMMEKAPTIKTAGPNSSIATGKLKADCSECKEIKVKSRQVPKAQ